MTTCSDLLGRTRLQIVALGASAFLTATGFAGPIHFSTVFPFDTVLTSGQPNVKSTILADLDGDGLKDVVAASQAPAKIAWYRNNGNGTFSGQLVISEGQEAPTCIFAADIDGDSKQDVVAALGITGKVVWFKNVGGPLANGMFNFQSGNPSANAQIVSSLANEEYLSVTVANVDASGMPDILATSFATSPTGGPSTSKVSWFKNVGTVVGAADFAWNSATPSSNLRTINTVGKSPTSIATADFDGNGVPDLVVTSENDNTIAWFLGSTPVAGTPGYTRYVIASNQGRAAGSAIADIDGDGYLDVACVSPFPGAGLVGDSLTWFRNNSHDIGAVPPYFTAGPQITGFADGARGVAIADLNGDGKKDAISASLSDGKFAWYENLGSGNFGWNAGNPGANQKIISEDAGSLATTVGALDFNQDGRMDLVLGSQVTGVIAVRLNRGGQVAIVSTDTAPTALANTDRDDVLRLAVSNRGLAGDNNAQLFSVGLLFEKAAGIPMTAVEANALVDNVQFFLDSNASGAFEPDVDTLVGSLNDLPLVAGKIEATLAPAVPANTILSPGVTRNYFVVAQLTAAASTLTPNTFRITHLSEGTGRSILKDATLGTTLAMEASVNQDTPSAFVTAMLPTSLQSWRQTFFGTIANSGSAADTANPDGDAYNNLLEFAFGTNPTVNQSTQIVVNSGVITPGAPTTSVVNTGTGVDFRALFGRRKDYVTSGLSYTVEFSADLTSWTASTATPAILADNGTLQAVTVPYPLFVGGKKARFFRVSVTSP